MKTRAGFVSNSSSSSFVCDVCGHSESGYDVSYSECGMSRCINDHTFCESHQKGLPKIGIKEKRRMLIEVINDDKYSSDEEKAKSIATVNETEADDLDDLMNEYFEDGCPPCQCPICMLVDITDTDELTYLRSKLNLTYGEVCDEIRSKFGSYSEFEKFLETVK